MTEADWRREHADPNELLRAADELRAPAARLTETFSRARREADGARWAGTAANRFRDDIGAQQERIQRARRALEEAATAIREAARRLQSDLERVRREDRDRRERETREHAH
jgi:uncharacterized protein YukE